MAMKQMVECDRCGAFGRRVFIAVNEDQAWQWDLCDHHAAEVIDPVAAIAASLGGKPTSLSVAKAARRRLDGIPSYKAAAGVEDLGVVRAWAREIGLEVPTRGRLDGSIIELWKRVQASGIGYLSTEDGALLYSQIVSKNNARLDRKND